MKPLGYGKTRLKPMVLKLEEKNIFVTKYIKDLKHRKKGWVLDFTELPRTKTTAVAKILKWSKPNL